MHSLYVVVMCTVVIAYNWAGLATNVTSNGFVIDTTRPEVISAFIRVRMEQDIANEGAAFVVSWGGFEEDVYPRTMPVRVVRQFGTSRLSVFSSETSSDGESVQWEGIQSFAIVSHVHRLCCADLTHFINRQLGGLQQEAISSHSPLLAPLQMCVLAD